MKTRLELTYDREVDPPQSKDAIELALKAGDFVSAMSTLDNWLRKQLKYDQCTPEQAEGLQAARDKFWEILREDGLVDLFDRVRW